MSRTLYVGKLPVQVTDVGVSFLDNMGTSIPANATDNEIAYIVRGYLKGVFLVLYDVVHSVILTGVDGDNIRGKYQTMKQAYFDAMAC